MEETEERVAKNFWRAIDGWRRRGTLWRWRSRPTELREVHPGEGRDPAQGGGLVLRGARKLGEGRGEDEPGRAHPAEAGDEVRGGPLPGGQPRQARVHPGLRAPPEGARRARDAHDEGRGAEARRRAREGGRKAQAPAPPEHGGLQPLRFPRAEHPLEPRGRRSSPRPSSSRRGWARTRSCLRAGDLAMRAIVR